MNFMRRLVSQPSSSNQHTSSTPEEHVSPQQEHQLAITHLRRIFQEFSLQTAPHRVQDRNLANMLPLFCQAFGKATGNEIVEKFPDVHIFCTHVARHMVREIKARATNQSTEEASRVIAEFLCPATHGPELAASVLATVQPHTGTATPVQHEESLGWLLLSCLSLLSNGPPSLVECITTASLPSTLVKCIYIFFDLPPATVVCLGGGAEEVDLENRRRSLLYGLFKQLLQRLCTYPSASEELAKKDDLGLLFAAVASWCPAHNVKWRKAVADVLLTIAQNGLTQPVIQYLHSKNCIAQCLRNVTKGGLEPLEVVDMFITLFHFLRESSESSQILLDDFRTCQGYIVIADFLLKLEKEENDEAKDALRNLVCLVGRLTTCGFIELRPKPSLADDQIFTIPDFELPQPSGNHDSVRNIQAFHVLQSVFTRSQSSHLSSIILDVIRTIYHQDPANYFILDPQNTIANFAEHIYEKSPEVQEAFFDIFESIVMTLKYVPMKEITSLTILIKTCKFPECLTICMRSLLKLTRSFAVFKDVFRDLGVLELAVSQLHQYANVVKQSSTGSETNEVATPTISEESTPSPQSSSPSDSLTLLGEVVMDLLSILLTGNTANAAIFRSTGGARCVLNMVRLEWARDSALGMIEQLVLTTGGEDDMATLLGLMHTAPSTAIHLKTQVLQSLCTVLRDSHRCRAVFRKVNGFVYVMQELVHMDGCLRDPPKSPWDSQDRVQVCQLLRTVFTTLTVAMKFEPANARHFVAEVRYGSLTEAVRVLGCYGNDVDLVLRAGSVSSAADSGSSAGDTVSAWTTTTPANSSSSNGAVSAVNAMDQYFWTLQADSVPTDVPQLLLDACFMARCLYDMALDAFDKPITRRGGKLTEGGRSQGSGQSTGSTSVPLNQSSGTRAPPIAQCNSTFNQLSQSTGVLGKVADLQQQQKQSSALLQQTLTGRVSGVSDPRDLVIVHAGAVLSILHLIPAVQCDGAVNYQTDLQVCLLNVIKALLRCERNQQVMCEVGMPHDLLTHFHLAMTHEEHPLHLAVQYLFERLASQALTPKDLREFMRLSNPLCCTELSIPRVDTSSGRQEQQQVLEEPPHHGGPVPISRVKCLVSMTTPRDARLVDVMPGSPNRRSADSSSGGGSSCTRMSLPPPFVEFDMSHEGFGCLFLPSISPQGSPSAAMVSVGLVASLDNNSAGGMGVGERLFPPANGFSFSTWFCVDRHSPPNKPHPIRLLTLVRGLQGSNDHVICLSISLMPGDRSLVVTSQERLLTHEKPDGVIEGAGKGSTDTVARFAASEFTGEGRWRHLILVFHRSGMMKHSSCSLYIDGSLFGSQKLNYISPNVTSIGSQTNVVTSVCAYVGTPPALRRMCSTVWRQGPFHLLEEPLNATVVAAIFHLGPNYVGSFQAPPTDGDELASNLFTEEKLTFGVFGFAISVMTIARMRKVYNQADAKAIARQLHMSVKENATPIRLLHNAASHLTGPARCIGAVLVGYQGVRVFSPRPAVIILECVGGTGVLLGLVAMANDAEGLYAAVKALCCVVRNNPLALKEMIRIRGFQILAMLFKKKRSLLNSHILHLTFALVGTLDSVRESSEISNRTAFEDLLCDLEVWRECSWELLRSLLEHLEELCIEPESEGGTNSSSNQGGRFSSSGKSGGNSSVSSAPAAAVAAVAGALTGSSNSASGSAGNLPLNNRDTMLELGIVGKLLHLVVEARIPRHGLETWGELIKALLKDVPRPTDLRKFGQFMVWTTPQLGTSEANLVLTSENTDLNQHDSLDLEEASNNSDGISSPANMHRMLYTRNLCFEIIIKILTHPPPHNIKACEELQKVLGFDWLLLFLQDHLHGSTVVLAMRTLLILLSIPTNLARFREGFMSGGWLMGTDDVLRRRHGLLLMHDSKSGNMGERGGTAIREINDAACRQPGFLALYQLLPAHCALPELYFLLTALLLGNKIKSVPDDIKNSSPHTWLDCMETMYVSDSDIIPGVASQVKPIAPTSMFELDNLYNFIFGEGVPNQPPVQSVSVGGKKLKPADLCPESAHVLLAMARAMISKSHNSTSSDGDIAWLSDYPITLIQFLQYLYQSNAYVGFPGLARSPDFLTGLASTLFPILTEGNRCDTISRHEDNPEAYAGYTEDSYSCPDNSTLSIHSSRKMIVAFLKIIFTDSLAFPHSKEPLQLLDALLEGGPENSTIVQQKEFQTLFLQTIMEHLLDAEILVGQNLPTPLGGNYSCVPSNVFYLTSRIVDKLWQEMYTGEAREVLFFVNRLLAQCRKRQLSADSLQRSLNRLILYQVSRPFRSSLEQASLLATLNEITAPRSSAPDSAGGLVFSAFTGDPELLMCVVHVLVKLVTAAERNAYAGGSGDKLSAIEKSAERFWLQLYAANKGAMEDYIKAPLNPNSQFPPTLHSVIHLLEESALKAWTGHIESECLSGPQDSSCWGQGRLGDNFGGSGGSVIGGGGGVGGSGGHGPLHREISVKLTRMSSGVLRLAGAGGDRSGGSVRGKRGDGHHSSGGIAGAIAGKGAAPLMPYDEARLWIPPHTAVVKELIDFQYKQCRLNEGFMHRYVESEWQSMELELTRERGLWGPSGGNPLDKWILDPTEGPCRMRKKMIRNDRFYEHYPHRSGAGDTLQKAGSSSEQQRPTKYKAAMSRDSSLYWSNYRPLTLLSDDSVTAKPEVVDDIDETDILLDEERPELSLRETETLLRRPSITAPPVNTREEDSKELVTQGSESIDDGEGPSSSGGQAGAGQGASTADGQLDSQATILRLLEPGERIFCMFRCARIQGLDVFEGLLLFGRDHFYVIDGFTLFKTRDIVDIDSIPPESHEPIVPISSSTTNVTTSGTQKKMYYKFPVEDIREVQKRRYLLQPIALEVFNADGRNFLLVFPKKMQNKVYTKFMQVAPSMTDNAQKSVSGQSQSAKMESGSVGILTNIIGEKSVTQRWERGELGNFQYLMYLNTLAGRSYNDLMQYPIFPWILADYESDELDLTSPNTFRDLSKPMGALNDDRLSQFKSRFNEWDDPSGETPPYHYGTHYSSAMIVASYLIRMEPFTQHFLKLQGGHFDLADRMFHSIADGWLSASKLNMADVKELIPEFFYLPDFLVNNNSFELGTKQNGVELGDVILPPWAKGDPREFIRLHREALECDYVSAHLHEWIDLIFGHKQCGDAAVDAVNVFHHLFYEGNVDIYSIDDPLKRSAVIGFINNFGQIPQQLFRKPHPAKRLPSRGVGDVPPGGLGGPVVSSAERLFYHNLDTLRPSGQPIKELKSYVGQIVQLENKTVLAVEQNKCFIPPTYMRYLAWGFTDGSLRLGQYESERAIRVFETADTGEILCAVAPNEKTLVTGGISTTVRVWQIGSGRSHRGFHLKAALYGHTEAVTCLAASAAWNLLVSGSRDRSCILWDLSRLCYLRQLTGHAAPVACVCINEASGDMATCAGTYLHLWTVNGEEVASVNTATGRSKQILTVAMGTMMEWDASNVIMTGGTDGVVRMWSLDYVQVPDDGAGVSRRVPLLSTTAGDSAASGGGLGGKEATTAGGCGTGVGGRGVKWSTQHSGVGGGGESVVCGRMERASVTTSINSADQCKVGPETDSKSATSDLVDDLDDDLGLVDDVGDDSVMIQDDADYVLVHQGGVQRQSTATTGNPSSETGSWTQGCDDGRDRSVTDSPLYGGSVFGSDKTPQFESQKSFPSGGTMRPSLNKLRPGFHWQRQLIFRSKLTMHTAYERHDNNQPAGITALAVSRDHRTVYVGDVRGRVYSWSVPPEPGSSGRSQMADHWLQDAGSDNCTNCGVRFSITERRHHCRNCGKLFCAKCSRYEIEIFRLKLIKPVRVCQTCNISLRASQTGYTT